MERWVCFLEYKARATSSRQRKIDSKVHEKVKREWKVNKNSKRQSFQAKWRNVDIV